MKNAWVLMVCGLVAGCGTHLPELTSERTLPMDALVAKIDCEFQQALAYQIYGRHRVELKKWQGAYTLTLKGNESGSLKANSNTFPFVLSKLNTLNLGVGAGVTSAANRTALLKFSLDFKNVPPDPVCKNLPTASGHPFFTGDIGVSEWLDRALTGTEHKVSSVSSLGHTFQFSIDVNANIAPSFVIGPAPIIGLNPVGTIDRLEDNSVDVVLAKAATVTESVAQVIAKSSAAQIAELEKLREEIAKLEREREQNDKAISENEASQMLLSQQRPLNDRNINDLVGPLAATKSNLMTLLATQKSNAATLKEKNRRLTFVESHPDVTTTTVDRKSAVFLPADQNPNIVSTQQLLTLERLNNTLRLNVQ